MRWPVMCSSAMCAATILMAVGSGCCLLVALLVAMSG